MSTIFMTFTSLMIIAAARNELVSHQRLRFLDELDPDDKKFDEKMALFHRTTYYQDMFDLTKWTYEQFYEEENNV